MTHREQTVRPRAVVMLAAGQGSRLRPLTAECPKSLLKVGDQTILETILTPLLETGPREIVVVTGFQHAQMKTFLSDRYDGHDIQTVENARYLQDTNILSTHIGVTALKRPEAGYFIVETDIVAPPDVWKAIVEQEQHLGSFWVTRGVYGPKLTGGIVKTDAESGVADIRYEPTYDARFNGWPKMVGILSVGPDQVADDIDTRAELLEQSAQQYYMAPWIAYPQRLPCHAFDLEDQFAMSFNTRSDYERACRAFEAEMGTASQ